MAELGHVMANSSIQCEVHAGNQISCRRRRTVTDGETAHWVATAPKPDWAQIVAVDLSNIYRQWTSSGQLLCYQVWGLSMHWYHDSKSSSTNESCTWRSRARTRDCCYCLHLWTLHDKHLIMLHTTLTTFAEQVYLHSRTDKSKWTDHRASWTYMSANLPTMSVHVKWSHHITTVRCIDLNGSQCNCYLLVDTLNAIQPSGSLSNIDHSQLHDAKKG